MGIDAQRPIIIKKIKKGGHGHHGGAWKIAYADFVTAMMAFFLLMWLLSSVNLAQRRGISEYFSTTVQAALFSTNGSGNRESIMDGGGADLSRPTGDSSKKVKEVPNTHGNKAPEAIESDTSAKIKQAQSKQSQNKTMSEEQQHLEKQQLQQLEAKIEQVIQANPDLAKLKDQIKLSMTPEGLRIQIMDKKNRPMFSTGSPRLEPYTVSLLHEIGRLLNNVPNHISIAGHTDAAPYAGSIHGMGYSNWELSSDRANACRRELLAGGMQPDKVLRVVGLADAVPYNPDNVFDPVNRRISITVLNGNTESGILSGMGDTQRSVTLDQLQKGNL